PGGWLRDRLRVAYCYKLYKWYNTYMNAKRLSTSAARQQFAELINRTAYRGERFVLQRRKKPVAAVIPIEEYDFLERMIEQRENEIDVRLARKARNEKGRISLEAVKKKLGF
ncbi:MAG: type II toxin-antitoxin system Phd/YefM family antitoxin, partial [Candidatus Acidiferrales bacterium]